MDFSVLTQNFTPIVVVACLIIGYIIKHTDFLNKIPNNDIPAILAVFGAILNPVVSGFTIDNVVYGALMGLASTGMHQVFKSFIEGSNTKEEEEE